MNYIHSMLRNSNLNLLPVFQVLLESTSVSQAAMKLNMTQSAVTHSLNKLRALFDDALFIRSKNGMTPTNFARSIQKDLESILNDIERLQAQRAQFSPRTSSHIFKIGITEYAAFTLLTPLLKILETAAPHIKIITSTINRYDGIEKLSRDNLDLIIGNISSAPKNFDLDILYHDYFVILACKNNKSISDAITLDKYQKLPHVKIALHEDRDNTLDELLTHHGITRNTVCVVGHYMLGLSLIPQSQKIITEPFLFALPWMKTLGLKAIAPPVSLPKIPIKMIWPRTHANDPAHLWLRTQLQSVAKSLPPK